MSIRVNMYAIDLPRFMAFVDQPIGVILEEFLAIKGIEFHGPEFTDQVTGIRYVVVPGKKIYVSDRRSLARNIEYDRNDSFLRTTGRDVLAHSHAFDLYWLAAAMADSGEYSFVSEITIFHRPAFVKAIGEFALHDEMMTPSDRSKLVAISERILQSHGRTESAVAEIGDFPILPHTDADFGYCVWNAAECMLAARALRSWMHRQVKFDLRDGGNTGTVVEPNDEWNSYMHTMIEHLSRLDELGYEDVRCLNFVC